MSILSNLREAVDKLDLAEKALFSARNSCLKSTMDGGLGYYETLHNVHQRIEDSKKIVIDFLRQEEMKRIEMIRAPLKP
jgi:hypothetical protein